jgi:hypothetical protein
MRRAKAHRQQRTPLRSDMSRSAWQTHMMLSPRSHWRMNCMSPLTNMSFLTQEDPSDLSLKLTSLLRYQNAIEDGRTSLTYKLQLYPEDSEIIAEAHYKLSLALEFASVTTTSDGGETSKREEMDQGLRDEAVKEMELAIKSFRLKMQNKEVELATMASPEDNELNRRGIAEMKELIGDMEQRV